MNEQEQEKKEENFIAELAKAKTELPLKVATGGAVTKTKSSSQEGQLAIDVYKNKEGDTLIIQATIAGVKDADLEIHITNESVTIKGERNRKEEIEDKNYLYQECFWGSFSRSIILPFEVDAEASTAILKNGILTIKMPKMDTSKKTKKLKVSAED